VHAINYFIFLVDQRTIVHSKKPRVLQNLQIHKIIKNGENSVPQYNISQRQPTLWLVRLSIIVNEKMTVCLIAKTTRLAKMERIQLPSPPYHQSHD